MMVSRGPMLKQDVSGMHIWRDASTRSGFADRERAESLSTLCRKNEPEA